MPSTKERWQKLWEALLGLQAFPSTPGPGSLATLRFESAANEQRSSSGPGAPKEEMRPGVPQSPETQHPSYERMNIDERRISDGSNFSYNP